MSLNEKEGDALQTLLCRLRLTIEWCAPRVSLESPRGCLRDLRLAPEPFASEAAWVVSSVADARQRVIGDYKDAPVRTLAGGRLLGFEPHKSLTDGMADLVSGGFMDVTNAPPWDTWVGWVVQKAGRRFLVSWIPPAFVDIVSEYMEVSMGQSIWWVDEEASWLMSLLADAGLASA